MNLELFIAKRIYFNRKKGEKRVSSPAIKIAIAGVAIGLAAMILSLSIVIGFKKEVRNKVIGFGSHIQISNFNNSVNPSSQATYLRIDSTVMNKLQSLEGIKHIELHANAPGIIKTDNDFQGVMLKGVDKDYDWTFFEQNMVEGSVINMSDTASNYQAIISKNIANKLDLKLGDSFTTYFIQESVRARKFTITGIYSTNFNDYDKLFIVTKMGVVQALNGWDENQVSNIELLVDDYDNLDDIRDEVFFEMLTIHDSDGNSFYSRSIKEINRSIFDWLELLDMNVWVIIILMFAISVFTMTSGLLIIILENTKVIGTLKTMGAKNYSIRKTFLYVSSFLIIKGMFWGNIIAIAIILIQKYFGIITLDPETYYVAEMPVDVNFLYILLLNVGTLIVTILTMVGPSYLIAKISPAKSIRFE